MDERLAAVAGNLGEVFLAVVAIVCIKFVRGYGIATIILHWSEKEGNSSGGSCCHLGWLRTSGHFSNSDEDREGTLF